MSEDTTLIRLPRPSGRVIIDQGELIELPEWGNQRLYGAAVCVANRYDAKIARAAYYERIVSATISCGIMVCAVVTWFAVLADLVSP